MALIKVLVPLALLAIAVHGAPRMKRVVGGAPYAHGDHPYHVSLWYMGDNNYYTANTPDRHHTCGGSLLEPNWVLTSAVCFDDNFLPGVGNVSNWIVALGMYNQLDALAEAQIMEIQEVFVVPAYNLSESHGDVALLKLSTSADLSDPNVDTIDINEDTSCPQAGETCTVIGWGQMAEDQPGNGSYVPNAVEVDVESITECAAVYHDPEVQALMGPILIDEGNVCAGVAEGGKDACSGDAGSPLLCRCGPNDEIRVSGSVTTGFGCARAGYSGVYSNTATYSSWIKSTIDKN